MRRVNEKALPGRRKIGSVAPTVSMKIAVKVTKPFDMNISIYFAFCTGSSIVWRNMISEKTML